MKVYRTEYPRPGLVRPQWLNLNGEWEFEIDPGHSGKEQEFFKRTSLKGKINVPFAPESKLSGVENVDFMQSVWYRREITVPKEWKNGRVLLHFGAVDYLTEVYVNGRSIGTHKGGYTPFCFDITEFLTAGANAVVVNAWDDTRNPLQPTGKQSPRYHNFGCDYTRSTGIWQTVWLEHVPALYIKNLKLTPDTDNSCLRIEAALSGYAGGKTLTAEAFLDGKSAGVCRAAATGDTVAATLPISELRLWNPGSPVLYGLRLSVGEDTVESYFGMRKVEINGYAIEINGRPVFQRLILDQGYYPDGIYTAPSDDDLRRDIELSMAAGYNGARMHMKIFEPRFLYWADRLGYMVWGEYPNWGLNDGDERAMYWMLPEWLERVRRDYNSPSVVGWCPFNETGAGRLAELFHTVYNVTKAYDPSRPVIDTSGYVHAGRTDVYDVHDYDQNPETFRKRYEPLARGDDKNVFVNNPDHEKYEGQPYFVSEFGGIGWDTANGWGYGNGPENLKAFYDRFKGLVDALLDNPRICAFCYTQLTDVMQERNGIYYFDRRPKFDVAKLAAINSRAAAIEKKASGK